MSKLIELRVENHSPRKLWFLAPDGQHGNLHVEPPWLIAEEVSECQSGPEAASMMRQFGDVSSTLVVLQAYGVEEMYWSDWGEEFIRPRVLYLDPGDTVLLDLDLSECRGPDWKIPSDGQLIVGVAYNDSPPDLKQWFGGQWFDWKAIHAWERIAFSETYTLPR